MAKFGSYLRNKNFIISIALLFSVFFAFYIIWTPLDYLIIHNYDIKFMPTPNETLMKQSLIQQIFEAVIFAPLLETFICQKGLYYFLALNNGLRKRKVCIMLIGAILFGLFHFYSLFYIIYNVFTGFLFMFAYIVKLYKKPYWTVVTLHGLMNLFAILIDPIEQQIFGIV